MAIKDRAITSHDMSPLGFNSITHALFELSLLELLSMKLNSRQKLYDKNYIKGLEMAKAYVDKSRRPADISRPGCSVNCQKFRHSNQTY